jgi:Family of unknown function (DUF6216)
LTRFRIAIGHPAHTVDEARRFAKRAAERGVSMVDLAECGKYADANGLKMSKVPGTAALVFMGSLIAIWVVAGALAGAVAPAERAVLKFTASGTYFFLSPTTAVSLRGGQVVRASDCAQGVIHSRPGRIDVFSGDEIHSLCTLLQSPEEADTLVHQYVEEQRAFAPVPLVMLVALLVLWGELRAGLAAFRLKRRLQANEDDDSLLMSATAVQV